MDIISFGQQINTNICYLESEYGPLIVCSVPAMMQKRLRREKRARRRLQEQLETELKRRAQLEDALKATGAVEQLRIINGGYKERRKIPARGRPASCTARLLYHKSHSTREFFD